MTSNADPDASRSIAVTWGTTAAERAQPFPCDRLLPNHAAAYFRGVTVEAPPSVVFRWLCQLRVAPYSYDWIDNLGRPSPSSLTPGLEQLAIGQTVMTMFTLAAFEPGQHLTLQSKALQTVFGDLAVTYAVQSLGEARSRLLVKLLVHYPRSPLGWLMRLLLPWGDLLMMRKQLLTLKRLAEQQLAASRSE